jgi:uncharacterized damage-inducible protein DinB
MILGQSQIQRLFDYDLWANRRWLSTVPNFKDQERAVGILRHILSAQRAWLGSLLQQREPEAQVDMFDNISLDEGFANSAAEWKEFLLHCDPGDTLQYTGGNGIAYAIALGDVVHHVLNHGTYHRGHLRGLAEAEGLTEFQDTDFAFFARTPGPDDL